MSMTRSELAQAALTNDMVTLVAAFAHGLNSSIPVEDRVVESYHDRLIDESIGLEMVPLRLDKRLLSKLQRIALDDGVNYLALIRSILFKEVAFLESISAPTFRSKLKVKPCSKRGTDSFGPG